MYRHDFPDLGFLHRYVAAAKASGKGWDSKVLHVRTGAIHRPDIDGPLSLFMNLSGESRVRVGKRAVRVEQGAYFLTNAGDRYTLSVDQNAKAETFNIHFGEQFSAAVFQSLSGNEEQLLAQPDTPTTVPALFSRLYAPDEIFLSGIRAIINEHARTPGSDERLEEQLAQLLTGLLLRHRSELQQVQALPQLRKATREEIYRRLIIAVDRLHSDYRDPLSLDQLAADACLSKFHFLRLFNSAFGKTPHQYLLALRMQKAAQLIRQPGNSIAVVAQQIGYEELSVFSRQFRRQFGMSAQHYKAQAQKSQFLSTAVR